MEGVPAERAVAPRTPLPVATLTNITVELPGTTGDERTRRDSLRTITYLMLFRLALTTILLLAVVALAVSQDDVERLGSPFARFAFALITTTYLVTIVYALVLPRVKHPVRFAYLQIGIDLGLIALLVHATGGAQSAYTFLFLVDVVAVALLPRPRSAAYAAAAAVLLLTGVSLLGYARILPPVPGQILMPWDMTPQELLFRLVLNLASLVSAGALGMNLATQTRQVGERLARQQQATGDIASLHQNTIRSLSSGLVTTSMDGTITSINEAACEILGIQQPEALGCPLARYIPGLSAFLEEAGPVGSVRRQEVDAARPDGNLRRLGVSATPLSDHTERIIGRVIHFQDLTELRRMRLAVERSERLASIGRLAAGIAHEIRNPLASISGSVEVLKSLPAVDGESRQLIDIAVREVDRLNGLITELLDYARPRGEDKDRLDLGELVGEITLAFQQERRTTDIIIDSELAAGVVVEGSSGQLRQVMWNLLRNAADAMPAGGTIKVVVEHEEKTGGAVEAGYDALLAVTDTGVGIPREDMDRIFEPFFSRKASGTGLGLATVARIVEDHRGTIDIISEPGRGTTFGLRFPCLR